MYGPMVAWGRIFEKNMGFKTYTMVSYNILTNYTMVSYNYSIIKNQPYGKNIISLQSLVGTKNNP